MNEESRPDGTPHTPQTALAPDIEAPEAILEIEIDEVRPNLEELPPALADVFPCK